MPITPDEHQLRQELDQMVKGLRSERDTMLPLWRDVSDYLLPRRSRFLFDQIRRGEEFSSSIIDGTAVRAHRNFAAGLMTQLASPAQRWIRLMARAYDLNEKAGVRLWLEEVVTRFLAVCRGSNWYPQLHTLFGDTGGFGTGAMSIVDHPTRVIQTHALPAGSYLIDVNEYFLVDTLIREVQFTVRQLVRKFGLEQCSTDVQNAWREKLFYGPVRVLHAVSPNDDLDPGQLPTGRNKRFRSVWWEEGSNDVEGLLAQGGFDEFPYVVPRWEVKGEDTWGYGPGIDALPDIKQLQTMAKRKAQLVEKKVNPPLQGPSSLKTEPVSLLPAKVNFVDVHQGQQGLQPVHEVDINLSDFNADIEATRQAVREAFYEDLFLVALASDRRQITATEVEEKRDEKMMMLGPAVTRMDPDLFTPGVARVLAIMNRRGMLPPVPPELEGQELEVEQISSLARYQKMAGTAGMERFFWFVGSAAQLNEEAVDIVDFDDTVRRYGEMVGMPEDSLLGPEAVAQRRQQRQQERQAAMAVEAAPKVADAAQRLSDTDLSNDSALRRMTEQELPQA